MIRSRPIRFPGPSRVECALAAAMLRAHPRLAGAFRRYREVYARSVAFACRPPPGCRVVHVGCDGLRTGRTTRDERVLIADYERGRLAGERALRAWDAPGGASAEITAHR